MIVNHLYPTICTQIQTFATVLPAIYDLQGDSEQVLRLLCYITTTTTITATAGAETEL